MLYIACLELLIEKQASVRELKTTFFITKNKNKKMLGSHKCDEFDESEETNQFLELAEFGSSLFPDHVKLAWGDLFKVTCLVLDY